MPIDGRLADCNVPGAAGRGHLDAAGAAAVFQTVFGSMTIVVKIASSYTIGEATLSPSFKYLICLLPLLGFLPFIFHIVFLSLNLLHINLSIFPQQLVYLPRSEQ